MNLWLKDANGRFAFSFNVLPMLGLKAGGHLPDEGLPPRMIQGIKVWVTSKTSTMTDNGFRRRRERPIHRVLAECPLCGKHLSVGRLEQHAKKMHTPERELERLAGRQS